MSSPSLHAAATATATATELSYPDSQEHAMPVMSLPSSADEDGDDFRANSAEEATATAATATAGVPADGMSGSVPVLEGEVLSRAKRPRRAAAARVAGAPAMKTRRREVKESMEEKVKAENAAGAQEICKDSKAQMQVEQGHDKLEVSTGGDKKGSLQVLENNQTIAGVIVTKKPTSTTSRFGLALSGALRTNGECSFLDMTREAISQLDDPRGVTSQSINKWISTNYPGESQAFHGHVKRVLKSAVESHSLLKEGIRYHLNGIFENSLLLRQEKMFGMAKRMASQAPQKTNQKPPLRECIPLSSTDLANLIEVSEFCFGFANELVLTPFTLDSLYYALASSTENSLVTEVHVALLRLIAGAKHIRNKDVDGNEVSDDDDDYDDIFSFGKSDEEGKQLFRDGKYHLALNSLTWPEILRRFLMEACYRFDPKAEPGARMIRILRFSAAELAFRSYHEMNIHCKIASLKALIDAAVTLPSITKSIDETVARLDELHRLRIRALESDFEEVKRVHTERQIILKPKSDSSNNNVLGSTQQGAAVGSAVEEKKGKIMTDQEITDYVKQLVKENNDKKRVLDGILSRHEVALRVRVQPWGRDRGGNEYFTFASDRSKLYVLVPSEQRPTGEGDPYEGFMWKCYNTIAEFEAILGDCDLECQEEEDLMNNLKKYRAYIVGGLRKNQENSDGTCTDDDEKTESSTASSSRGSKNWRKKLSKEDPGYLLLAADKDAVLDERDALQLTETFINAKATFKLYENKERAKLANFRGKNKNRIVDDFSEDLKELCRSIRERGGVSADFLEDSLASLSVPGQRVEKLRGICLQVEEFASNGSNGSITPIPPLIKKSDDSERSSVDQEGEEEELETNEFEMEEDIEKDFVFLVEGKTENSKRLCIWDEASHDVVFGELFKVESNENVLANHKPLDDKFNVKVFSSLPGATETFLNLKNEQICLGFCRFENFDKLSRYKEMKSLCEISLVRDTERDKSKMALWPSYRASMHRRAAWNALVQSAVTEATLYYLFYVIRCQWFHNVPAISNGKGRKTAARQ